jgi:transcriptional regulator with XRE-family HTH domain
MAARMRILDPGASPRHRLGAEIRHYRRDRGLSQAALGLLVHVSADLIRKVECADRFPSAELIAKLDQVLGAETQLTDLRAQAVQADGAPSHPAGFRAEVVAAIRARSRRAGQHRELRFKPPCRRPTRPPSPSPPIPMDSPLALERARTRPRPARGGFTRDSE